MPASAGHPDQPSGSLPSAEGLPEITPDIVEQEHGDELDNIIPTDGYGKVPVVGLGGSAGALAALQTFFGAMPPDTGMAFVVIMHLSPQHESNLAELLQRSTAMPVRQVRDRLRIEPDHVYVIPPANHLSMADGALTLTQSERSPGRHVAVDLFFRALADTQGPHSVAVVLSGADGDGAIGLKRVKERGGLTVVQQPEEAEHDGMPRSSIATGLVDWVLPVAQMPARLVAYWQTERRLYIPADTEGRTPAQGVPPAADETRALVETTLHDILGFLRVRTGHDFTYYKRATVLRRIGRRMQVHGIDDPLAYLEFLRSQPAEPDALLRDLLISVTNFFRDREAFAAFEARMPSMFRDKGPGDQVRVWCAACATGEEAYSVAMLLHEYADTLPHPPTLQVFATDLDERAIAQARDGAYSETIAADVSEARLRRFFSKGYGGYRVRRELRETVLFALHDVLKDSPFSRLDAVTCRNLLIYLNRDAQARTLDIFHFALRPEGTLFLGSSESVDDDNTLFTTINKKGRVFARGMTPRSSAPLIPDRSTLLRALARQWTQVALPAVANPVQPVTRVAGLATRPPVDEEGDAPVAWSDLHYEFIERMMPPSVLVNAEYQIVHVSEHAGRFLRIGGGDASMNLLHLVHPTLRIELRAALYQAAQSHGTVETRGLPVETDRGPKVINLRVAPSQSAAATFLLVIFEEQDAAALPEPAAELDVAAEPLIRRLEKELERTRLQLRNTVEQSDASTEELKATNEEFQAMNEELRSTTEELETGREELQSVNEELSTVNQELKSKVEDLGRANSDLQNLMASTQIATVFLDNRLCVQRYTPPAVALFRLIPTDVGRPLEDLANRLSYPNLKADAERVLERLEVVEVEVAHADSRHFLARMLPYRTTENVIAGVVMTFVDITQRRQAEEALRESEGRFRTVSDVVPDLLFSTDPEGRLLWCNERWRAYTGQTLAQAQGYGWVEIIHPEDRDKTRSHFLAVIGRGEDWRSEHRLLGKDGRARWFLVRAEPLRDAEGRIKQWFGAKTDIEDFKRASADLTVSEERMRQIIENAHEFVIFATDLDGRITTWNPAAERITGYSAEEARGQQAAIIFTPEDRAAGVPEKENETALAEGRATDERWHQRKDGSRFWGSGAMMAMRNARGQASGFVKIFRDQTEARQTREELQAALRETEAARAEAEAAGRAKDHFLAVLSHELRTPLMPVMLAANVLARHPELPEVVRESVAMIQRNVEAETHLIDDLLDVTRISRGKLEIVSAPMDLHEALRRAVEVAAPDVEAKGQKLEVALGAPAHRVHGDLARLQQVFWNLLKNAAKFTPGGGRIRLESRAGEPGWIEVEVTDNGIGIEEQALPRIFGAFTQAGVEITRQYGGLGLGLAISKATMDAHGGTLTAGSGGAGQGATFTVRLPLAQGA